MADPYISEVSFLGTAAGDFIEVALDVGASTVGITVTVYNPNGTVRSVNTLGTLVAQIGGKHVYVISTGIHRNGAVALDDNGTLLAHYSFDAAPVAIGGPADGLTPTKIGTNSSTTASLVSTDGTTYIQQDPEDPGVIPCFATGTMIRTANGPRRVEDLSAGDPVQTVDNGDQPVRLICQTTVDLGLRLNRRFSPIRIKRGALGQDRPSRDLIVSPNHRISVRGAMVELNFATAEVLVPAKSLCHLPGISRDSDRRSVTYVHLLFDQHQMVWSNDLRSESFYPAAPVLDQVSAEVRQELLALFPDMRALPNCYGKSARLTLKSYEALLLAA
jgi:hypothetical protein